MARAPFAPLLADGEDLDTFPERPTALIARMAAVYGLDKACVLPTQGVAQALSLVVRRIAMDDRNIIVAPARDEIEQIVKINRVARADTPNAGAGAVIIDADALALAPEDILRRASTAGDALLVLDESFIEFEDARSAVALVGDIANLIVIRNLAFAYGLAGAPCAALIAAPALIARLREAEEPGALAAPIVKIALSVLEPQRVAANALRIQEIRTERARLAAALPNASEAAGPFVWLAPNDREAAQARIRRFALEGSWRGERFLLALGAPDANDRALAAFDVAPTAPTGTRRMAEVVRDTHETRIVVRLDLDREGACSAATGVGFFDHMLSQIATHGGFSLALQCEGDLEVDAHHTIEDCALALGQALKQALGARRGLARFGFTLPMDEAEARVSVDLGGRPYLVFDGAFTATHIGVYPTEMTEHVFRSLAQSMGAAIHVHVTGENDHHKTEACYKAFGRALRQALRVEGEVLPSTKGVI
jgi:imidazoleglycerol phosphate dehydratase HisB/histidinol-phosphate/aromatic aminotransferase/cobyric acid decarboxylase-like protein